MREEFSFLSSLNSFLTLLIPITHKMSVQSILYDFKEMINTHTILKQRYFGVLYTVWKKGRKRGGGSGKEVQSSQTKC